MARLAEVVRDMQAQAARQGDSERTFADGLTVHYVAVCGERMLTLRRLAGQPAEAEILRWQAAFAVPIDAQLRQLTYGIEARWPAPVPGAQVPARSTL